MKTSTGFRKIVALPGVRQLWGILMCLIWLALWQLAYEIMSEDRRDLLLSSPLQVAKNLTELVRTREYWSRVLFSSLRIMAGMLMGAGVGVWLGVWAFFVWQVKDLLKPLLSVIRSIPVVSFIILAIYWLDYRDLGMFIAFLICFPVFYSNTLAGLGSANKALLEMADVFRFGFFKRLTAIYLPSLLSHLYAAGEVAVGLAWKSGTAAEFIASVTTVLSIGGGLFNAKRSWSTVDMLSWTVTIVALNALFGFLFKGLLKLASRKWGES